MCLCESWICSRIFTLLIKQSINICSIVQNIKDRLQGLLVMNFGTQHIYRCIQKRLAPRAWEQNLQWLNFVFLPYLKNFNQPVLTEHSQKKIHFFIILTAASLDVDPNAIFPPPPPSDSPKEQYPFILSQHVQAVLCSRSRSRKKPKLRLDPEPLLTFNSGSGSRFQVRQESHTLP